MILFSFLLALSLQRIIEEFENNSPKQLTQNISSLHQNIAFELQSAIENIKNTKDKERIQKILKKHNSYSIESIFGDTNASYAISQLYVHLDTAKTIIDEVRGHLEQQKEGKNVENARNPVLNLKSCISYIGQEYDCLQYYEQTTE